MKLRRYLGCTRGRRKEAKRSPSPQHSAARVAGASWGQPEIRSIPPAPPDLAGEAGCEPPPWLGIGCPPELTHLQLHRCPSHQQHRHRFLMKLHHGLVLGLQREGNLSSSPGKENSARKPFHSTSLRLQESTPSSERGCPHGGWLG